MPAIPLGVPGSDFSRGRTAFHELTWGEFDVHVQAMAQAVAQKFRPQAVVGLVHGGLFVGGALAKVLKVEFFPVRISRRSRDQGRATGATDEMPQELKGLRVLVVDDVASSGDSLEFASRLARAQGAKAVQTAALIARPGGFEPDFAGIVSPEMMVFPWDYQDVVQDDRFETGQRPVRQSSSRK